LHAPFLIGPGSCAKGIPIEWPLFAAPALNPCQMINLAITLGGSPTTRRERPD